MDPDWEEGMWDVHGLVNTWPVTGMKEEILEQTDAYTIRRTELGAVYKRDNHELSIAQHLEEALLPTRESWAKFKTCLDPGDSGRYADDWEARAKRLEARDHATAFLAGSLFGLPREWMGLSAISMLSYDNPALYEEIIDHLCTFYTTLLKPVLAQTRFDFAYFFEDGGFIPLPDHRIPPECTLDQFRSYVSLFKEVYGTLGNRL